MLPPEPIQIFIAKSSVVVGIILGAVGLIIYFSADLISWYKKLIYGFIFFFSVIFIGVAIQLDLTPELVISSNGLKIRHNNFIKWHEIKSLSYKYKRERYRYSYKLCKNILITLKQKIDDKSEIELRDKFDIVREKLFDILNTYFEKYG